MHVTFTNLEPRHLNGCAELFMEVFNGPPWSERWQAETALEYLQDLFGAPRSRGLVAQRADEVIGFALGRGERRDTRTHFYLTERCVLALDQGQGVGRQMLSALEHILRSEGVGKVFLLTTRDGAAEAFYRTCGFYTSQKMVVLGKYL